MKPLGVGVWEYVGVKKTPVRPHSHTQLRSARAFSIEIGANRLRSSALIGNLSLIGLRAPVGGGRATADVLSPVVTVAATRWTVRGCRARGRSRDAIRTGDPLGGRAGPQWKPHGSVTTWPLPDRADSAFPHIRFRVFPTDTSAVMKVIVTYIRSIVQDRVVGRLREMKVPGASLFPVHGFGLERPSHDWWVSPPRPANRQFHERCVFASIPLPP
jgi:hypothetical protein